MTDADIDAELDALRQQYPAVVEGRAAKEGDVANIDYVGTKDGVAFDGGTASGYNLSLGNGGFIDGFEDGVVGMMPGEEKDLNLTFPEEYHSAELAGQDVVFHVTLNQLMSPEETAVDDDLAKRRWETTARFWKISESRFRLLWRARRRPIILTPLEMSC